MSFSFGGSAAAGGGGGGGGGGFSFGFGASTAGAPLPACCHAAALPRAACPDVRMLLTAAQTSRHRHLWFTSRRRDGGSGTACIRRCGGSRATRFRGSRDACVWRCRCSRVFCSRRRGLWGLRRVERGRRWCRNGFRIRRGRRHCGRKTSCAGCEHGLWFRFRICSWHGCSGCGASRRLRAIGCSKWGCRRVWWGTSSRIREQTRFYACCEY
jgi:hypothetical protein